MKRPIDYIMDDLNRQVGIIDRLIEHAIKLDSDKFDEYIEGLKVSKIMFESSIEYAKEIIKISEL